MKNLLRRFDLILSVSRSIPMEMGKEWTYKIVSLDPGVALSQEDLQLINKISSKNYIKEEIVVFGGRPIPEKGIIEALLTWKTILKK